MFYFSIKSKVEHEWGDSNTRTRHKILWRTELHPDKTCQSFCDVIILIIIPIKWQPIRLLESMLTLQQSDKEWHRVYLNFLLYKPWLFSLFVNFFSFMLSNGLEISRWNRKLLFHCFKQWRYDFRFFTVCEFVLSPIKYHWSLSIPFQLA